MRDIAITKMQLKNPVGLEQQKSLRTKDLNTFTLHFANYLELDLLNRNIIRTRSMQTLRNQDYPQNQDQLEIETVYHCPSDCNMR